MELFHILRINLNSIMAKKININQIQGRTELKYTHSPVRTTVYFLIVSEGTKTEPNYFETFIGKRGSKVVSVNCKGRGKNTTQLIAEAKKIQRQDRQRGKEYDSVWIVFDKDNFPDEAFNNAILAAPKDGISVAWNNPSIELWYLLHLVDTTKELTPEACINEIEKIMKRQIKSFKYDKASSNFSWLNREVNQSKAIKRAKLLQQLKTDKPYAKQNPCTTVDKLVCQLIGKDEIFNNQVSNKIWEKL